MSTTLSQQTAINNASNNSQIEDNSGAQSDLRYPSDFDGKSGNWITFQRVKYTRPNIQSNSAQETVGRAVSLPVPPQLASNYLVDWGNTDLGVAGNAVQGGIASGYKKYQENKTSNGNFTQSIMDMFKDAGTVADAASSYLTASAIDGASRTNIGEVASAAIGIARNPHKAHIFNSPAFRQFSFQYKLIAKNSVESESIFNIIREFKLGMMPSFADKKDNNIFTYPDMFVINFAHPQHLFRIGTCILKDVSVDYHGEGSPVYFGNNGGKSPFSINLSLAFSETEVITREKIEEGF